MLPVLTPMWTLILFIVFGLGFGFFATQNTNLITVHFGLTNVAEAPLYVVVLTSLGIGVLLVSIFYLIKSISMGIALNKKEKELANFKKENAELLKELHQVELENSKLKGITGTTEEDENAI